MAEEQTALIELSTERPPPKTVLIDGKAYALRSAEEFSMRETHRMLRTARRFQKLAEGFQDESREMVDSDADELQEGFDQMVSSMFADPPEDVLAKLHDRQKMQIVQVFFPQARPGAGISPKPSPDSNGSMEAAPATG